MPEQGFRRCEEGLQQGITVEKFAFWPLMELGMPLHPADETAALPAYGLDFAVLGSRLDRYVPAGTVDALMVNGDDASADCVLKPTPKLAVCGESHGMDVTVVFFTLMGNRSRSLARQVLVQRAAKGDIDQLHAATDTEHGLACLHELMQKFQLVGVAHGVPRPLWL